MIGIWTFSENLRSVDSHFNISQDHSKSAHFAIHGSQKEMRGVALKLNLCTLFHMFFFVFCCFFLGGWVFFVFLIQRYLDKKITCLDLCAKFRIAQFLELAYSVILIVKIICSFYSHASTCVLPLNSELCVKYLFRVLKFVRYD